MNKTKKPLMTTYYPIPADKVVDLDKVFTELTELILRYNDTNSACGAQMLDRIQVIRDIIDESVQPQNIFAGDEEDGKKN